MPHISASIIIQLLTVVHPTLAEIKKEGESGRRKISQYTRYGTCAGDIPVDGIAKWFAEYASVCRARDESVLCIHFTAVVSLVGYETMF